MIRRHHSVQSSIPSYPFRPVKTATKREFYFCCVFHPSARPRVSYALTSLRELPLGFLVSGFAHSFFLFLIPPLDRWVLSAVSETGMRPRSGRMAVLLEHLRVNLVHTFKLLSADCADFRRLGLGFIDPSKFTLRSRAPRTHKPLVSVEAIIHTENRLGNHTWCGLMRRAMPPAFSDTRCA